MLLSSISEVGGIGMRIEPGNAGDLAPELSSS
jgi:hypothetical protein